MPLNNDAQLTWDILKIPNPNNLFQQHRLLNDKVWLTMGRGEVAMSKMSTNHIKNSIAMLERSNQTSTRAYRGLTEELQKREK